MMHTFNTWLNKRYPQNYILRNPYLGTLIIFVFCFGFLSVYKPLHAHGAQKLSYIITMAIYCVAFALSVFIFITALKRIKYFSFSKEWTIRKELLSILLCLAGMGLGIYFTGFFVEEPAQRWNFPTFLDSCLNAVLIGIIPFLFFSIINYRSLGIYNPVPAGIPGNNPAEMTEQSMEIISKLKKESLSFLPDQFLYAVSDGNYVVFYLNRNTKIEKEIIRNSISDIENQLSQIPFFMRTHRAFIVNVKKVRIKNGNSLGYHLGIPGIDIEIPVSRQYTRDFIHLFNQYTRQS